MFAKKQVISGTNQPAPVIAVPAPGSQSITPVEISIQGYAARRSYAFDLAEDAFWQGEICAEAYMLFRLLTRLCKDKTYCWPGLDYLAERMQTSIGTIKRRLDVLERAALIERKQRSGGLTSYTYVRPLQQYDVMSTSTADAGTNSAVSTTKEPSSPMPKALGSVCNSRAASSQMTNPAPINQAAEALFFVPTQEINTDSPDRSALISHTVKSQNINLGGGGSTTQLEQAEPQGVVNKLLEQAGVLSPVVRAELENTAITEVEACLAFAQRQRNIADPAAFAVSLIRLGMGPKLAERALTKRRSSRATGSPSPLITSPADPSGYTYYYCEHGRVKGGGCAECDTAQTMGCERLGSSDATVDALVPQLAEIREHIPPMVWTQALAKLRERLPIVEFDTWLRETQLIGWYGEEVVISTPNIFAREQVQHSYSRDIAEVVGQLVGRSPQVKVVIDSP